MYVLNANRTHKSFEARPNKGTALRHACPLWQRCPSLTGHDMSNRSQSHKEWGSGSEVTAETLLSTALSIGCRKWPEPDKHTMIQTMPVPTDRPILAILDQSLTEILSRIQLILKTLNLECHSLNSIVKNGLTINSQQIANKFVFWQIFTRILKF